MKYNSIKYHFIVLILISFYGCGSDDSSSIHDQLTLEDYTISIDELPINNNDFLGTLNSNMEGHFNIVSENPEGAISIDSGTGDIYIADISAFDYEINSTITAVIQVSTLDDSAQATITINLNNLDEIEFYLTSSKQSYIDATVADWVLITEDEFNNLAIALNDVSKVATSDDFYNYNEMIYGANSPSTWAHNNGTNIPNNSYVFAFKYYSSDNNVSGTKVKQSMTSVSENYVDLGNPLPVHNSGEHHFVLKGNDIRMTNTGYLAIYSPQSIGFKPVSGSMYVGEPGDVYMFFNIDLSDSIIMYQGLSTTLKQWD